MTAKRTVILVVFIIGIIVSAIIISRDFPSSTLHTINQSNQTQTGNLTFNNTPIDDNTIGQNATTDYMKVGDRSQGRLIYGGIISILLMQMIILVLIIQCRKHRTYVLKPKPE